MHQRQDRPPGSSRPSLLSPGATPDVGNQGILSQLDGKTKPSVKAKGATPRKASGGKWRRAGSAALLLALCAGAAVWIGQEEPAPMAMASAPVTVAAPPAPALAPAVPVAAAAAPAAPEQEVSAAAILNDTPGADPVSAAPPAKAAVDDAVKPAPDELVKMFEAAPVPAAKAAAPVKTAAVKTAPAKEERAEKPKTANKPAARPKTKEPATRLAKAPPKKTTTKAKPAAVQDSDVLLLAALVAHSKTHPEPRISPVARKIGQCKKLGSVAESEACRAKVCASTSAKDAACKGVRVAQVETDA